VYAVRHDYEGVEVIMLEIGGARANRADREAGKGWLRQKLQGPVPLDRFWTARGPWAARGRRPTICATLRTRTGSARFPAFVASRKRC
jgi:hypothetical protein